MPGPKHREDPGSHGIVCAPSEDRKEEVAESMRMCPDCFEEAIQEQRKESFQAMADELSVATHRALCRGVGVQLLRRRTPRLNVSACSFPFGRSLAQWDQPQFGMRHLSPSPWAFPRQLCDLGQVTSYHEASVCPRVKRESWARSIQRFLSVYSSLICEVQHSEFQNPWEMGPKPTNVRSDQCLLWPAKSRPYFETVHTSLQMHVHPAVSSMWFVCKT